MKQVLVFAGTSEGRRIVEELCALGAPCTACVATGYGREMLPPAGNVRILSGRMDAEEIRRTILALSCGLVVDATHPYAVQVSENIRRACAQTGTEYLRVARGGRTKGGERFPDAQAAVRRLNGISGNILLTTGSKDLPAFTGVTDYRRRVYARVLPAAASLERCARLGYPMSHVIAMQGPFSEELNAALLRQFSIAALVTKDSGRAGGFGEKAAAAEKLGVALLILERRGPDEGLSLEQALTELRKRYGTEGDAHG